MSNSQNTEITDHKSAAAWIAGGRSKADRAAPSGGANTRFHLRADGSIDCVQHSTAIITYRENGTYVIRNGGWFSVTTKKKIQEFSPVGISQSAGVWYISSRNPAYDRDAPYVPPTFDIDPDTGERTNYVRHAQANDGVPYWLPAGGFADGMEFDSNTGEFSGHVTPEEIAEMVKANKVTRRRISKYVKLYTDDRIAELLDPEHDSGGDCFTCRAYAGSCHESHVEESYTHRAMLNATAGGYFLTADARSVADGGPVRFGSDIRKAIGKRMRETMLAGVATR